VYLPDELIGYRFNQGRYYVAKYVKSNQGAKKLFVEYLVKGVKSLYFYGNNEGTHYLVDAGKDTLVEIPDKKDYVNVDGTNYVRESKSYIGYLKSYFNNCPQLFEEIDRTTGLSPSGLVKLTRKYHDLTCGDSSCVVFYKPKSPVRFMVEPQIGTVKYSGDNKYELQSGILLYLWSPRSSERWYFKTGFIYTSAFEGESQIIKVPIQFEYLFPDKLIRPKIDFGCNYWTVDRGLGKTLTLASSIGILIKVSKCLYFDINVDADICQLTYDTGFFISHAANAGICIKL
jgi:hypothetical protein